MTEKYDISVCICTYNRPTLLWSTLESLARQTTSYFYNIIVVDNDRNQSARSTCEKAARELSRNIQYLVEPRQNISLARNMAINHTKSELVALIDDDEIATDDWIDSYVKILMNSDYDYAVGPVHLIIPGTWPYWLVHGGMFHEKRYQKAEDIRACTNNVCFKRRCLSAREEPFDPQYGRTGGEDKEFGTFLATSGFHGIWCQQAKVYEIQENCRRQPTWHLKRAFQHGLNHSAFLIHLKGKRQAFVQVSVRSFGGVLRAILCYAMTFYDGRASLFRFTISMARQSGRIGYFFGIRKKGY